MQRYDECHSIVEGQVLDPDLCPPGFPPGGEPIEVYIDEDGTFGPILIWHVPEDPTLKCTLWEIVAERMAEGHPEGFCNADEDGLNAVACDEPGFHILPEALTIIVLSLGLAGLGDYFVARRRKEIETNV